MNGRIPVGNGKRRIICHWAILTLVLTFYYTVGGNIAYGRQEKSRAIQYTLRNGPTSPKTIYICMAPLAQSQGCSPARRRHVYYPFIPLLVTNCSVSHPS